MAHKRQSRPHSGLGLEQLQLYLSRSCEFGFVSEAFLWKLYLRPSCDFVAEKVFFGQQMSVWGAGVAAVVQIRIRGDGKEVWALEYVRDLQLYLSRSCESGTLSFK